MKGVKPRGFCDLQLLFSHQVMLVRPKLEQQPEVCGRLSPTTGCTSSGGGAPPPAPARTDWLTGRRRSPAGPAAPLVPRDRTSVCFSLNNTPTTRLLRGR